MAGEGRFTTGSTLRHVTVMSLTGSVGLSFMFLIDVATLYWVSYLQDETLVAGVGLAWAVQLFTISFGIGLGIAGTALVGRALGMREGAEARRIAASGLVLASVLMCLMALIVILFRGPLIDLTGAAPASAAVAKRFLLISVPSLPALGIAMMTGAILRAEGDAFRAMWVTTLAGAVAMVLDPIVIVWGGFGVDGAAAVLAISRATAAGLGLWFVIRTRRLVARPSLPDLRRHIPAFFAIAGPAVLTQLSTPFGNFILTGVIAAYGDAAVAGWSVVSRVAVLAFGGIFALSGAIGGILSQNYGARRMDRVRSAYRDALLFCAAYVGSAWLILALLTEEVVALFHLPSAGAEVLRAFTHLGAGAFVFAGFLFVSNAAFNNLRRPLWSSGFNWLRDGLMIAPLAWAMAGAYGAPGVVYAQGIASILAGGLAATVAWRFVARAPAAPVLAPA